MLYISTRDEIRGVDYNLNVIAGSVPGSPAVGQGHPATGESVGGEEKEGLVNDIM